MAKTFLSVIDIAVATISLFSFVLDVGTDVAVCVQYLINGPVIWGWMTLAITAVAAIVMNAFSFAWNVHDKTVTPFTAVIHLTLTAPIQRYVTVLHLGVKSWKSQKVVHSQKAWSAQNDVSILRLFEAFIESAPQLVLQLFVMIHIGRVNWFTGLSASASFLSLSWALTAYSDSLRRACKADYHRRVTGLFLHWTWQLFMALSRISAFVFFAHAFQSWIFVVIASHWLLSFVWICIQGTDFGNGFCEKWMFRGVCAFIYVFVFFNVNDGKSRYRMATFYTAMMLENAAMIILYFLIGEGEHHILAAMAVFGSFIIGLICMLVYYGFHHPSKPSLTPKVCKLFRPQTRLTSIASNQTSIASSGNQRQEAIFSLDSPQVISVMDGTSINLSLPDTSDNLTKQKSALHSSSSSKSAFTAPLRFHQNLRNKWQSGMDSSCTSSSSSLASDQVDLKKRERPSSRASENSNESERSNNCLIVSDSKNDLNKSTPISQCFKQKSIQSINKISYDESSFDMDKNVNSESPSLSRCSWARSSDQARQSLGMDDFVTLGFDCSSSIDRRVSENSSFDSRPKSLSPLNVSNLWQDARSKLRQTIAATIAAATCNPSSNEGTPNRSQSFLSHTNSSQDESSNSSSHNFGFMDSKSSYHDRDKDRMGSSGGRSGSVNSAKQREGLSSLPDIYELVENEQLSDVSYDVSIKKSPSQGGLPWSGDCLQFKGSPYLEDSTLTASKLVALGVTPISILNNHSKSQSTQYSTASSSSRKSVNSNSSKSRSGKNVSSGKKVYSPNGSPFTEQELTSLVAKSLQVYMGASSSTDSTNTEREGLALTLDDLKYPLDMDDGEKNDEVSMSLNLKDSSVKSRSTSSLFHDGEDSSPASSASKMQRITDLKKADCEISPNAFKHLDLSPSYLSYPSESESPVRDMKVIHDLQTKLTSPNHSEALKILMEAYGQLSMRSPQIPTNTLDHSKLSVHGQSSNTRTPRWKKDQVVPKEFVTKSFDIDEIHQRIKPELKSYQASHAEKIDDKRSPTGMNSARKHVKLFDSIAWQKSKLEAKKQKSKDSTQAYAGQSCTKKLNVHNHKHHFDTYDSHEDNDVLNYVEGKYCPPLCKTSSNAGEGSILNNLNTSQGNSHKSKSPKKEITIIDSFNASVNLCSRTPSVLSKPAGLHKFITRRNLAEQEAEYSYNSDIIGPTPLKGDVVSRDEYYSCDPAEIYFNDSVDINEARVADSPLSYSHHQRSLSLRESATAHHTPQMNSLTEQELKVSAKHVEQYFSQALRYVPKTKSNAKPKSQVSRSDVDVHRSRKPLKSLQNSPQHLPHGDQIFAKHPHQLRSEDYVGRWWSQSGVNNNKYTGTPRQLSLDSDPM